jgi:hypothetical protein
MDMLNPLLRAYEETARPLGELHALNPLKLLCEVAKRNCGDAQAHVKQQGEALSFQFN